MKTPTAARIIINLGIEALERLIGGNTEIEIELRNTIVQQFAKRHLKSIANSQLMAQTATMVRAETHTAITEHVGTVKDSWSTKDRKGILVADLQEAIRATVRREAQLLFTETTDVAIRDVLAQIPARVEAAVTKEVERQAREIVRVKLDEIRKSV